MNNKYLYGLLFLCVLYLMSCQKEEFDFSSAETEDSTVFEGTILTTDGLPLTDVEVKVDYHEGAWLNYSLVRHKAKVKTDKKGKYRLFFNIKEDEQKEEKNIYKSFSLIVDLKNLNQQEYIFPGDMSMRIKSVDSPIKEPVDDLYATLVHSLFSLERGNAYTQDFYIPKKRKIRITLKGFNPKQNGDCFNVSSCFPYGGLR